MTYMDKSSVFITLLYSTTFPFTGLVNSLIACLHGKFLVTGMVRVLVIVTRDSSQTARTKQFNPAFANINFMLNMLGGG